MGQDSFYDSENYGTEDEVILMKPDHIVRIWGKTEGDDAMAGVEMGFGG